MLRLRELRSQKGVTQQSVADAIGIERSLYVRYEDGSRVPPLKNLLKLADYFEVTLDLLSGRTEGPLPEYEEMPDSLPLITDIAARNTHGKEPITRDQVIEIVQEVLGDFRREQQRMNDIKRREDR